MGGMGGPPAGPHGGMMMGAPGTAGPPMMAPGPPASNLGAFLLILLDCVLLYGVQGLSL